jgi:hypothetical protein
MIQYKKLVIAGVLACFAGAANAALWCKNSDGEQFKWSIGDPRPVDSANFKTSIGWPPVFNHKNDTDVVCFVNGKLYLDLRDNVTGIRGFPVQGAIPNPYPGTGDGKGPGTVYRGDAARWLIDNLPTSYGQYADWNYYNSINP